MKGILLTAVLVMSAMSVTAQESRLSIGGYGEAVMTRNFYSQNFNRYSYCLNNPMKYTDQSGNLFGIDDAIIGWMKSRSLVTKVMV